jgi:CDP-glucose 4,6-dehydratase
MEVMVIENLFNKVYKNKKVLITGHTGFKGAWLSMWLQKMGAIVDGYSLNPKKPNIFESIGLNGDDQRGNIQNKDKFRNVILNSKPDIIFHLAAQPIVKTSYSDPEETILTNTVGTMNLLEIIRKEKISTKVICITTDKVYHNYEWVYGYKESDPLGGHDTYSASKACAELIINSYQKSFFNPKIQDDVLLASARAGNVIGGGDWGKFRIIPDIINAVINEKKLEIRSPDSVRPWQHVLEPLSGYLLLGKELLEGNKYASDKWNFGPNDDSIVTVKNLVKTVQKNWPNLNYIIDKDKLHDHEAKLLKLDCSKSKHFLKWSPVLNFNQSIKLTVDWYKNQNQNSDFNVKNQCHYDLNYYVEKAAEKNLNWI